MTEFGRFWEKAEIGDSDSCWLWQAGMTGSGYGKIRESGTNRIVGAHVKAFELMVGEVPQGLHVCHHCDNKRCVNPSHLFLGSRSDNMLDCQRKGRHPGTRITREVFEAVRDEIGTTSQQHIADRHGVDQTSVSLIKRGKGFKRFQT